MQGDPIPKDPLLREAHPLAQAVAQEKFDRLAEVFTTPPPQPETSTGPMLLVGGTVAGSEPEWGRVTARLMLAGCSTIEVGQCGHGWFARGKVPNGRATVPVQAHGFETRLQAVTELADQALAKSDGKRRRSAPAKRKAKRKGRR